MKALGFFLTTPVYILILEVDVKTFTRVMTMKITIKDIAKEAGVSIATVSRVINEKDRVDPETRAKVQKAIKKSGFQPDLVARTMVMKESRTIGLLVPTLANEYWALLSEAIQEELWAAGYTLMLCTTGNMYESKGAAYIQALLRRKMDGIIIGAFHIPLAERDLEVLLKNKIPMVAFDQRIPGVHMVSGDHFHGAMEVVQHLVNLGHKRIAYIHGAGSSDERELGYRCVLESNGIGVDGRLIKKTRFGIDQGHQAVIELIESGEQFTSVFCWNDLIAFGAIKALQAKGFHVPEDVAVVGYDDIITAAVFTPSLTTMAQPIREIGSAIVKLLMESIHNQRKDSFPQSITFQMKLKVRESCGAGLMKHL